MSVETVVLNGLGLIPAEIISEIRAGIEDGVVAFRRHAEIETLASLSTTLDLFKKRPALEEFHTDLKASPSM